MKVTDSITGISTDCNPKANVVSLIEPFWLKVVVARLTFVSVCAYHNSSGSHRRIAHVISSSQWRPIAGRKMKDGGRSGRKVGWQVRPQGKRC